MSRQALDSLRETVTVKWPAGDRARAKALLIKRAQDGHAKIMAEQTARTGAPPTFEYYVNTPGNTNFNSLIVPGPIVFKYRYVREVMIEAIGLLRDASPVISGAYRDHHTLYLNGEEIQDLPKDLGPGDTIMIANPLPYARRIEIGRTEAGRPFVMQVPNRIYERVAKNILIPRYENVVDIKFDYVQLPGAYTITGGLGPRYRNGAGRSIKRRQNVGGTVPAPAIIIKVKT